MLEASLLVVIGLGLGVGCLNGSVQTSPMVADRANQILHAIPFWSYIETLSWPMADSSWVRDITGH